MRRIDLFNQLNEPQEPIRYREITITNNESSDLDDFQVVIEISGDFLEKANPNKLVLADSNNVILPYWVEEWKRPSGKARIWTKIDLPASGSKTLKLYYQGVEGDNEPDGDSVFEFFDDFDSDGLDDSKWNSNSNISVGDSQAKFSEGVSTELISKSFPDAVRNERVFEAKIVPRQYTSTNYSRFYLGFGNYSSDGVFLRIHHNNGWMRRRYIRKSGSTANSDYSSTSEINTAYVYFRIVWTGTTVRTFNRKPFQSAWTELSSAYSSFPSSISNNVVVLGQYDGTSNIGWVDWVFVRKYTSNEPSVSVGDEQTLY